MGQRFRVSAGLCSLGVAIIALISAIPIAPAAADTTSLAIDRTAYVPNPPGSNDAYLADSESQGGDYGPDPISMHDSASGGQVTYYSFVHLELNGLVGDTISSLQVTVEENLDAEKPADNVQPNVAILDAFPLKTELPAGFSGCQPPPTSGAGAPTPPPCTPPAYDSSFPAVVGKIGQDADGGWSWTFELSSMLPYWQQLNANTGIAIVPDAAATQTAGPFAVALSRAAFVVTATYTTPNTSVPQTLTYQPPVAPPSVVSGNPQGGSTAPTSAAAPSTPRPTSTPHPGTATIVTSPGPAGGGGVPLWLLILVGSLAASVALLAQPVSQALSGGAGLRVGFLGQLRLHPRMFAVAGGLMGWSLAFGAYSGFTSPNAAPVATRSVVHGTTNVPGYSAPDQTATPGGTPASGAPGSGPLAVAPGTVGADVFANQAAQFNPAAANLYNAANDVVGLTNTTVQLCAHAALTFGPAFNIGAGDLNVFWQWVDNPSTDPYPHSPGQGGIWNRRIVLPGTNATDPNASDSTSYNSPGQWGIQFNDDGYQPSKAVQAAQTCQDQAGGDFFLLSGIGFDQIPAVRVWAEQNQMLYIHHIATAEGSQGLRYSFTMLPSVEQIGQQFGQLYLSQDSGLKVGIIERDSSNWIPGVTAFQQVLSQAGQGGNIVKVDQVQNNQGEYQQQITDMEVAGAQVVLIWENALAATNIIEQAQNQQYVPKHWMLFPFNLSLYTEEESGVAPSTLESQQAMIPWPAYTSSAARCNTQSGSGVTRNNGDYDLNVGNSNVLREIQQFESVYASLDPKADMCGDGGDLLFGTWEAWKQVADLLYQCGPDCTRNKVAGLMLNGYDAQVGSNCAVDFRGGDGHHGGGPDDVYGVKQESGQVTGQSGYPPLGWVNEGSLCQTRITSG